MTWRCAIMTCCSALTAFAHCFCPFVLRPSRLIGAPGYAGTVARSVEHDAPTIRAASETQQQQLVSAVHAALREADAALRSEPAEQARRLSPPADMPMTSADNTTIAEASPAPQDAAAGLPADLSGASAYAATALAPQPSVLEPLNASTSRKAENGEATVGSPDEAAPMRQGIRGTVSRLKALFEKNHTDR